MPDWNQSLAQADYGQIKIIAEKWGLQLQAPDGRSAREELVTKLLERGFLEEKLAQLPESSTRALAYLEMHGGKVKWTQFVRQFGEIREMGAGRRERYRPENDPVSTAEQLWYRGLIARGFFDTEAGPQEFAYLPEDLRPWIQESSFYPREEDAGAQDPVWGRKATPDERRVQVQADEWMLDHLCTLLSAARMGINPVEHLPDMDEGEISFYQALLQEAGIVIEGQPEPNAVKDFFELSREQALIKCWKTWKESRSIQDVHQTPAFILEGEPNLDPPRIRKAFLKWIRSLPANTWWSLSALTASVQQLDPDFLRVTGDYESWFIKNGETGEYLRGFQSWDQVEGELIRYLITGPGHWLGVFDLAYPGEKKEFAPAAFRISARGKRLLQDTAPDLPEREEDLVQVWSKGLIKISRYVDPKVRYQVGRFCDWVTLKGDVYHYQLTTEGLHRAQSQGLDVPHLLALLKNHTEVLPPNIVTALERWSGKGVLARIHPRVILRVNSPAVLDALQKTRAQRFLQEQLGPTTIVLQEGSEEKVAAVLIEMGFMVEQEN